MWVHYRLTGLTKYVNQVTRLFPKQLNLKSTSKVGLYFTTVCTRSISISEELLQFCKESGIEVKEEGYHYYFHPLLIDTVVLLNFKIINFNGMLLPTNRIKFIY